MKLFKKTQKLNTPVHFGYMEASSIYLDSACQTLRPQPVIDAMAEYFQIYNACGGRVKYAWGMKVDEKVEEARRRVLEYLCASPAEYDVAFTLNTTYGLNLVLGQLPRSFSKIVTSDIEHNSVFLSTMSTAKRLGISRTVLPRADDGSLEYSPSDLENAVVVLNSTSNIDGRSLRNVNAIARDVHASGGILLIDAAQGMSHNPELLRSGNIDVVLFSGHKLYGPSLGCVVIKRELLSRLDITFIGGGMVEDVAEATYSLVSSEQDMVARLEPGLQDFAGIIGLNAALSWIEDYKPEGKRPHVHQAELSEFLFRELKADPRIHLVNTEASPIVSFYADNIDSHKLAIYLSAQNIMVRSGYFCCHYFLKHVRNYPPLVRMSLGLHSTKEEVERSISTIKTILSNV